MYIWEVYFTIATTSKVEYFLQPHRFFIRGGSSGKSCRILGRTYTKELR